MTISLPILDLSKYQSDQPDSESSKEFLKQLYNAMTDVGVFYIKNHGVPFELQQKSFETIKSFFDLPLQDKLEIELKNSPHFRGYSKLYSETTDYKLDNREQIDLGRDSPAVPIDNQPAYTHLRGPNQWPTKIPEFKETISKLMNSMAESGLIILKAMIKVLNFNQEEILSLFDNDYGVRCKLLRYPALNNPIDKPFEHGLGVGPHKDTGFLTILLQDQIGGLQVQTQTGEWLDVLPIPNTFIINIGEILERMTKQIFVATTHRVINKPLSNYQDRFSIPVFLTPALETRIPQFDLNLISNKKEIISDVKQDQLLQHEIYGMNEFHSFLRSHRPSADKWYYFNEEKNEWQRKSIK